MTVWRVGDVVTPNLEHSWVYGGTEWQEMMNKPRQGVIVEVPIGTATHGFGTVLVKWESLTEKPLNKPLKWTSTDLIQRLQPTPYDREIEA